MQSASFKTICEKCGKTTVTKNLGDVQVVISRDGNATPIFVMFCPEHRAEWIRLLSDFLEGVPTDA